MFLMYVGLLIAVIGGIGSLIAAFKTHILWGIACLLFAPASLVFLVLHWSVAKNPFFLTLLGVVIMFLSAMMGGHA
ncbi:MAG: hypothetical protein E6Q25_03115 [Acinetobacter sp.]|nr:MAG: hypothetical protein E6Q25_03115 [Acinetobacter sp.]